MNYIKAKFPNSTRSYAYRTEDSVKAGDTVVNSMKNSQKWLFFILLRIIHILDIY